MNKKHLVEACLALAVSMAFIPASFAAEKVDTKACVACHSNIGGFHQSGAHKAVSCTSCHDGLAKHVKAPGKQTRPATSMDPAKCGSCHKPQFESMFKVNEERVPRDSKKNSYGIAPDPFYDRAMGAHGFTKEHDLPRSHAFAALDQFLVDRAFGGVHILSPYQGKKKSSWYEGTANASSDTISVRVIGKGGHGAHPEDCVDPLTIGAGLLMQLQTIISRRNKATDPAVLTFGEIHGGTAPNVIPSSLDMYGTLRTFDNDVRRRHLNAIRSMCAGFCRSLGGDCEVAVSKSMPPLINSPDVCRLLQASAASVLGAENVRTDIPPSMGSDDFSCLLEACGNNGAQFLLGTALAGVPQSAVGLHAAENIFPDEALTPAAAVLAQFALDYLRA